MMNTDQNLLLALHHEVEKFKKWISQNFSPQQITEGTIDDAGYPEWDEIEQLLQAIFAAIEFKNLNAQDVDNLIYLIARNWDIGIILNWSSKDAKLSQLGMTEEQFLVIAKQGVHSSEWDARYQIAGLLHSVSLVNKETAIELALKYHEDKTEFVRRKALISLYKLNYPNMLERLEQSWLYDEEYERMICLYLWREIHLDKYNFYLNDALMDDRAALREYAESLHKGIDSWSI